MHPQYFEGTLQLRNPDPEVVDFVRKQIKKNRHVFVAKESRVRGGIDIQLSSQKFMQQLGKKLQQSFGGDLKISRKLYSRHRQTGKNIYRVNVMFRLSPVRKGDVVEINGDRYEVLSAGKKVFAKDLDSGKKKEFSYDDLR
ncbi:hypothetical protein GF351_05745 [Candidatus Woesearchaeota archaeon]|nr:hypothetical protein [Candidatus Woesearchaeota archaeon]